MKRLVYTEQALVDLGDIFDYVAQVAPGAAERLGGELMSVCDLVASNPMIGERQDSISAGLRRLSHAGYAIYFRNHDDAVRVVRILHHSRDVGSIEW